MRDNLNEYNGKMNKKNPKTNTYMSFFQCHCHYGWIITLDLRFQNVLIIFRLLARCSFHFFFCGGQIFLSSLSFLISDDAYIWSAMNLFQWDTETSIIVWKRNEWQKEHGNSLNKRSFVRSYLCTLTKQFTRKLRIQYGVYEHNMTKYSW